MAKMYPPRIRLHEQDLKSARALARFPDYLFLEDGRVASLRKSRPVALRPRVDGGGYHRVYLTDQDGVCKKHLVHRLIAEAFHGECPEGMQCCHLDGDRSNNSAGNLLWATPKQNCDHRKTHGTHPAGEMNPRSKLTIKAVEEIRRMQPRGKALINCAEEYGVSASAVSQVISGRTWRV